MSLQDTIKKVIENAPAKVAPSGFMQYGKVHGKLERITWGTKPPVTELYTENMEINDGSNGKPRQSLKLTVTVDVKELNPSLQFEVWERNLLVEQSNKTNLSDWDKVVFPALKSVMGDKWVDFCMGKYEPYAEVEQAPRVSFLKEGAKDYGVPKFHRVFKSIDECKAARDARFGTSTAETVTETSTEELGIPANLIEQAKTLYKSVKQNESKFKALIGASEAFKGYDVDAVFAEVVTA